MASVNSGSDRPEFESSALTPGGPNWSTRARPTPVRNASIDRPAASILFDTPARMDPRRPCPLLFPDTYNSFLCGSRYRGDMDEAYELPLTLPASPRAPPPTSTNTGSVPPERSITLANNVAARYAPSIISRWNLPSKRKETAGVKTDTGARQPPPPHPSAATDMKHAMLAKNTHRVSPVVIPAGGRMNERVLDPREVPPSRRLRSLLSNLECASWHDRRIASSARNIANGTAAAAPGLTHVPPCVAAPWIPIAVHAPNNSTQSTQEHASIALRNVRPLPLSAISFPLSHMHAHQCRNRLNALASGGTDRTPPRRRTCVARRIAATSLTATARARESNAVVSSASRVIQLAIVAGHAATSASATRGSAK